MSPRIDPDDVPVFHVKPEPEQQVARMQRNLKSWASTSRKAWRTRKNMAEHRAALVAAEREDTGE